MTASGTATFTRVAVEAADIGRALATDLAEAMARRTRSYIHAAAARSAEDPQVLQVVGRIRGDHRHWRNARPLASHNPRIYKDRIVSDYAVDGTVPPPQWRVGQSGT